MYQALYENIIACNADISICGAEKVHNELKNIKLRRPKIIEYTQAEYVKKYFKIGSQSCEYYAWNKLYKREKLNSTQYPTGLTSEDVLGTYKALLRAQKIVVTTQNYYHYRQNSESITGSFSKKDFDLTKVWDKVVEYTKNNAPEYLDYATLNRKRINFTLLYRIAINGLVNQPTYNTKTQNFVKDLKQDKRVLLKSPIPFTRKVLILLFCLNYKISATVLYTVKSPYFLFSQAKQTKPATQTLTKTSLLFILFSLIVFFEPQAFKESYYPFLTQIDNIYKILKLICSTCILILYFKKCRISKIVSLACAFQLVCLFSTIINHGSITRFTGPALTTVVMAMSAELLIHSQNLFPTIKKLLLYFRVIFALNIITILLIDLTPLESPVYFLGIDNRWIFTYLPWICFEFLYSTHVHGKIDRTSTLLFVLSELTLVWEKSWAAMLLFALWGLSIIKPKIPIAKHAVAAFTGTVATNIAIVILRIQNIFTPILNKIGKGATLSGRTHLWDSVFNIAKKHPWLGNGMQTEIYDKNLFFTTSKTKLPFLKVAHAHNTYMTTLYRYGGIGLSLFTMILYLPIKKLKINHTNQYANIITICIIITLLLGIFDTLDYSGFYFILSCAYGIEFITPIKKLIENTTRNTITSNKKKPKVSIVVPVYNAQESLSNCIYSILDQSYDNFELIIVDDGSTDESKKIYESIKDKRIKAIYQENSGASSARNTGLSIARGEYITFVDADDTISPNMLSTMIYSVTNANADVAVCNPRNQTPSQQKNIFFEAISYNYCWETWGKLIRYSTIKHLFNTKVTIGEDLLFYYENYKMNKNFVFIDDNLYYYNLHHGSLMHSIATAKDLSCLDVLLQIIDDQTLTADLRVFYQAYYIQAYYRIFARSSHSTDMESAKSKYSKNIDEFYKTIKAHHQLNLQIFIKHRLTWFYNIIERLQVK